MEGGEGTREAIGGPLDSRCGHWMAEIHLADTMSLK